MSRILLFAGTSEGRRLSEWLCERNTEHGLCVATAYGEQVLNDHPCAKVHMGRMDTEEMIGFMTDNNTKIVIDATHPYAKEATENIKRAAAEKNVRYLRLERDFEDTGSQETRSNISGVNKYYFNDAKGCAEALIKKAKDIHGNILITTGSKELSVYCADKDLREKLIVRVLPGKESIEICEKNNLPGRQIIAMQGPFSVEMNRAIIKAYDIKIIVSKLSGKSGGYFEKEEAAYLENADMYLIGRPENSKGLSFDQVTEELNKYTGKRNRIISLIGCGMGSPETLTREAIKAVSKAGIIFGAKRLISGIVSDDGAAAKEIYPYYLAKDIMPVLKKTQEDAAILFSGDTGFFSGTAKLYEELKKENNADIRIYPGISSVSYLSALTGISWDDAKIFSVHGKGAFENWAGKFLYNVRTNKKTFMLLSGAEDLNNIGRELIECGLEHVKIIAGYQMSYPEQEISILTPGECVKIKKEGLYSLFVINEDAKSPFASHGLNDSEFIRGKVPMTKEEVREISISKLRLRRDSVVYDIGSGTGSVAVEIARLSPDIKVYALERKQEALELIKENAKKNGLSNIHVIESFAPDGIDDLEAPTHVFIGGTGGNMKDILKKIFEKTGNVRICANAVSLETFEELISIEKEFDVTDYELVQVAVTRTKPVGSYRMLQAENPIWICSFEKNTDKED